MTWSLCLDVQFFIYCPVLLEYVLVLRVVSPFSKVNDVPFHHKCLFWFERNLLKLLIFIFTLFYGFIFFLWNKLHLCWIFFLSSISHFPLNSIYLFVCLFSFLCKLYFPSSISHNGWLNCFRTMWRYLKNSHSGSKGLRGCNLEDKGIQEGWGWHVALLLDLRHLPIKK